MYKCYESVIPFFKFRDNNLYFVPLKGIKLALSKQIVYANELKLNNVSLCEQIYCSNYTVKYNILKEEYNNYVKVHLRFNTDEDVEKSDIDITLRHIVGNILKKDIEEYDIKNNKKKDDFYDNKNLNKSSKYLFEPAIKFTESTIYTPTTYSSYSSYSSYSRFSPCNSYNNSPKHFDNNNDDDDYGITIERW